MSQICEGQTADPACKDTPSPRGGGDTEHRVLRDDEFWRRLPGYAGLSAAEFNDYRFQSRNCVTSVDKLRQVVGAGVSEAFYADMAAGIEQSTMSLRVSPYILALINWAEPENDPLRLQFLPLASRSENDHPELGLDSLNEQGDSPVPGLTHRYTDRALFLALDTCPVYCRFCTRSYAIGLNTAGVEKLHFGVNVDRWQQVFEYVAAHEELEDIVISGGDMYNLKADHIRRIGSELLDIDHIRRLRFATKGPAVMPQKLVGDDEWVRALGEVVESGRKRHREVVLHTHFNHPNEITSISRQGLDRLMELGVTVRNQSVLQRGVNDNASALRLLVRRLSYVNVHPYYMFLHDMVQGVEELRTSLDTAIRLEKEVRGITAGFNIPSFVLDTMGGGGKRHVHSHEHYDRENGIAVFTSPAVKPGRFFYYFDPLRDLDTEVKRRWADAPTRQRMLREAVEAVAGV